MPAATFSRGAPLTGAPTSDAGVFAAKVRFTGTFATSTARFITADAEDQYFSISFEGVSKYFAFYLYQDIEAIGAEYAGTSTPAGFSSDVWYSIVMVFYTDSANPNYPMQVWINNTEVTMDIPSWDGDGLLVDWSVYSAWQVGNLHGGGIIDCDFIWFEPSLSGSPVYSDFFETDGCVKDLGADGSTPTGSQPMIYMTGGAVEFQDNKGYGGAFAGSSGTISSGTYTCP